MKTEFQSHDLTLPAWGPYTKQYSGISHISAANDGVRFDLAVFPGLYRRRVDVPNVRYESGYHVWQAAPDLSCYTLRHELEWKDRVYADISFAPLGENARLIRAECRNETDTPQNLVLHYMASAHDPVPSYRDFAVTGAEIRLPAGAVFLAARDYDDLHFAVPRPTDGLCWDGMRRAEEAVPGFVRGYGVGLGFGCAAGRGPFGQPLPPGAGDTVSYTFCLPQALKAPCLCVRYVNGGGEASAYALSTGETLTLPPSAEPAIIRLALAAPIPAGAFSLTLTAAGTGAAKLDCFVLCEAARCGEFTVTPRGSGARPSLQAYEDEQFLTLQYPHIHECYGVLWEYGSAQVREIEHDELDIFLRDTVHDHVNRTLRGNGKGHFTNVFQRPIPLRPGETRILYGAVLCADTPDAAAAMCRALRAHGGFEAAWRQASAALSPTPCLPAGAPFALGQQLMQAVTCSNVVYPVYTRGQYIRHNTPGRWWDSLYTWDSGFIGMGLAQYSARRGFDCLNAYLTPPGDNETAFIHHGSMVPTQFYLFAELLNQTQSRALAEYCYPRLAQYYAFFTGQAGGSTTANLCSGLLRPWDYFYNSGGWDDYPPQQAVLAQRLQVVCTPVVTTAHAVRCAKILAYTARLLAREADAARYNADVQRFTAALEMYAWDEDAGYFGYVVHDADGRPVSLLRHDSGANWNMGLGGASPLFANACSPKIAARLWEKLEDPAHLWTDCGLSTVDRSAPYYRRDGYWNGAVWMPYQWLFFKAALDAGKAEFAFHIAKTALRLWQDECAASYHCFEHFMIESRRGAGWHQFSGLSAPVIQWFASYYVPGTLTAGFDTFVRAAHWLPENTGVTATLDCTRAGHCTVLAALAPGAMCITSSAPIAGVYQRHDGLWELTLAPKAPGTVELSILPKERCAG